MYSRNQDIGIRAIGDQEQLQHGTLQLKYCQHTAQSFCKGSQIIVLGQVNVCEEMKEVEHLDFHDIDDRSKLSQLVEKIDKDVSHIILILNLVKPNNNMVVTIIYGNIKGTAKGKP
jgi:hypothetical protein